MEKMKCLTAGTSALGFLDFKILFKKRSKFPGFPGVGQPPFLLLVNKKQMLIINLFSHLTFQSPITHKFTF